MDKKKYNLMRILSILHLQNAAGQGSIKPLTFGYVYICTVSFGWQENDMYPCTIFVRREDILLESVNDTCY